MNSPHFQLAKQIEANVQTWAETHWSDAHVEAGFRIESYAQMVENVSPQMIAIVPTAVEDDILDPSVNFDQDLITISVLVLTRLKNTRTATIAIPDSLANKLRRHLKTFEAAAVVVDEDTGHEEDPEIRTVNYVAVFDHPSLTGEIFASAINMQFALCTGELE